VRPERLPLYDDTIPDNATTVVWVKAETAHQVRVDNYTSLKPSEQGKLKLLQEVVDDHWIDNLKDANTSYTNVTALEIITYLETNSGGLHAIDMLSLWSKCRLTTSRQTGSPSISQCWRMPRKKAKRVGMPITDVELVMMASAAVLAVQHFPHEVDNWEGLPTASRMWPAWKTAFRLAHLK
jgi:hypothetical protein